MARANPFRFSTKYQDDESDLLYYGCRYYNASIGRWLSTDPIEERGGLNLYLFVGNNCLQNIDPRGLSTLNVVYDFGVKEIKDDGSQADTVYPALSTLSPKHENCYILLDKFSTEEVNYTVHVRFAPGVSPSDPLPWDKKRSVLSHEMVHVAQLATYMAQLESVLKAAQATSCVCLSCWKAKASFFTAVNAYFYDTMVADAYAFDDVEYHQWGDESKIYRDAAARELASIPAKRAAMNKACGISVTLP